MKSLIFVALILVIFILSTPHVYAHGPGGFSGGGHMGHFGGGHFSAGAGRFNGGFHGSLGGQGLHFRFGNPAFRSPSFGHFRQFPHHKPFGFHHQFSQRGIPFFSSGFSERSFFFSDRFGPVVPPPLGAVDPTPFAPVGPQVQVFPFFCALHRFGYTNQAEFFGHLNFAHHVPLDRAASFCLSADNGTRLIFSGF